MLVAVVVAVFAAFKMQAERYNTGLSLIAHEQDSHWHHTTEPDGSISSIFGLQVQATNMSDRTIHLSKVRLNWPWVSHERILYARLDTEDPTGELVGSEYGIEARDRRACHCLIVARGMIGGVGRKKPMRVAIAIQDDAGRWHKLVFRSLRASVSSRVPPRRSLGSAPSPSPSPPA